MEKSKTNTKKILLSLGMIVLVVGLCVSIGFNIYQSFWSFDSYLQSTEEIYTMESGILRKNLEFRDGTEYEFRYDFTHENYEKLKSEYNIEATAKDGTEFERALCLMNEYAPRLTHKGDYKNHIDQSALELLAYSLNNEKHGINCRAKAQILNEMCLSLGIYSRKVWIMPYSEYDTDCHVVNEVWDSALNKWVMLDITTDTYWVDEKKTPLSVLEIREKAALRAFCTPVGADDNTSNLQKLKEKNIGNFLYVVKNMVYMEYCTEYTVGESEKYYTLLPQNMQNTPTEYKLSIGKSAIEKSPIY